MEFLNVFASVDKDQDLVIHEADLDKYAAEMKYEKAFTTKWLRLFDLDKDGKISFSEFCETLGLDEKIYEEKLREVRKNLAEKQQQPSQQQQQQSASDRATRRTSRLPRAAPSKPVDQEVKENIAPLQTRKVRTAPPIKESEVEVDDEVVNPQISQKAKAGVSSKSSPEEVRIEFDEGDPRSIKVEFSDMEPSDLEEAKRVLAQARSDWKQSGLEKSGEFDRRVMHEMDKRLGNTWQCQSSPELSYKEVNYQEGSMAVLVSPENKRVMVWKPQPAGGFCCCC